MEFRIPAAYQVVFQETVSSGSADLLPFQSETRTKAVRAEWVTLKIHEATAADAPVTLAYRADDIEGNPRTMEVRLNGRTFYRPADPRFAHPHDGDTVYTRHIDVGGPDAMADLARLLCGGSTPYDVLSRWADAGPSLPPQATVEKSERREVDALLSLLASDLLIVDGKVYIRCDEPTVVIRTDLNSTVDAANLRVEVSFDYPSRVADCHFRFDEADQLSATLRSLGWDFSDPVPGFWVENAEAFARIDGLSLFGGTARQTYEMTLHEDYAFSAASKDECKKARDVFATVSNLSGYGPDWSPTTIAETCVAWGRFNDAWAEGASRPDPADATGVSRSNKRQWLLTVSRAHQERASTWAARLYPEALALAQDAPATALPTGLVKTVRRLFGSKAA